MKLKVYTQNGWEERDAPDIFEELPRKDLILRAVLSEESYEYQPKGNYKWAGMQTSADYIGRKEVWRSLKNRGQAKLPREKLADGRMGRVRVIPSAVGGRRAHPPKVEKRLEERMNRKEYLKALRSALSAVVQMEWVKNRGHKWEGDLPIVIDVGPVSKTKQAVELAGELGLNHDLERSKKGRKPNPNSRYGGTITPKSVLVVCGDVSQYRGFRNLPGVDVVDASLLRVKDLAPGGHPGRLTLFTWDALEKLAERLEVDQHD